VTSGENQVKQKPWLGQPAKTIEILQKYHFRFQKKYGQNFLIDPHVLEKIVRAAEIGEDDMVLEIGPGIGTLTQYLAYAAREVCAIEIDRNLIPILTEDTLKDWDNVTVICRDVMDMDLCELVRERNNGRPVRIAANLPYYITTPILMKILEEHVPCRSITVMVQSEVADRMRALPGTEEYGALSLAVQYYTVPEVKASVPPNCFMPRPNVGSTVITLKPRTGDNRICVRDEKLLFRIIRASFAQRRKTLMNGLRNSADLQLSKEQAEEVIAAAGFPASVRGEKLSLEDFAALSDIMSARGLPS
jgi:16S rRNA (adenine1518-N6/adenine1519-N6)-dimethyltransferase